MMVSKEMEVEKDMKRKAVRLVSDDSIETNHSEPADGGFDADASALFSLASAACRRPRKLRKVTPGKTFDLQQSRERIVAPKPRLVTPRSSFIDGEAVRVRVRMALPPADEQTIRTSTALQLPVFVIGDLQRQQERIQALGRDDSSSASDSTDVNACLLEQPSRCDANVLQSRSMGNHSRPGSFLSMKMAVGLVVLLMCLCAHVLRPVIDDPHSVYVPGAGFSGFWFTLGRLKSTPNLTEKNFYCYSAGCLGVVAALGELSMEQIYGKALDAQMKWNVGHITRHDIVDYFLNDILFGDPLVNVSNPLVVPRVSDAVLKRLNIITTAKDGAYGLKTVIRTPTNILELHEMLLQTTWIPFAVGSDLWHYGADGIGHMDGAFLAFNHPRCNTNVGLVNDIELILNILNVNLGRDKVEKFWNAGLSLGS